MKQKGTVFKLDKSVKRVSANFLRAEDRNEYLNIMISAQRLSEHYANTRRRPKDDASEEA